MNGRRAIVLNDVPLLVDGNPNLFDYCRRRSVSETSSDVSRKECRSIVLFGLILYEVFGY